MRRRVIAGIVASVAVVALASAHSGPDAVKNESGVTTSTSEVCAVMGDGTIEKWHDATDAPTSNRVPCTPDWAKCWGEPNDSQPGGVEVICPANGR